MRKKALIIGITGQDGSYLAEFLLDKGYEVHGLTRRTSVENPENAFYRINHIRDRITLHNGSIESQARLLDIFEEISPNECYHLAAKSFVHEPFDDCSTTFNTNIHGTLHVLSAAKKKAPSCRIYFAGTSEMFGNPKESPQTEGTVFRPRSPYGVSKLAGYEIVRNFREELGMHACTGILFNHESPRRGGEFVTKKITRTVARMRRGETNILVLGNIDARRDWGFAGDYVEAMWKMLQRDRPEDFVIATGRASSVRNFLDIAFNYVGLDYKIIDLHNLSIKEADAEIESLGKEEGNFVIQHPLFYRRDENGILVGNPEKARNILGWSANVSFKELVKIMMDAEMAKD